MTYRARCVAIPLERLVDHSAISPFGSPRAARAPSDAEPRRACADSDAYLTGDLREGIFENVRRLSVLAIDVLVLDQTRPDLVLSAVKVFGPGLRHFRRRLGAGRLCDAPVRLGWPESPRAERDMNALPLLG